MISDILKSELSFSVDSDGGLSVKGPKSVMKELLPTIRRLKPELMQIVAGDSIADVGQCDHCNAGLIGLPVSFDGYVNRVCGACGRWAICLPPWWTVADLDEHITERAAIMEYGGKLSRDDADRESIQAVRVQLKEQKSIFESAERIEYKGGRQSGRTDDRDNQLTRS